MTPPLWQKVKRNSKAYTDGEIKSFSDKQKLREFSATKPALQQMLNGLDTQEIQQKIKYLQNQP